MLSLSYSRDTSPGLRIERTWLSLHPSNMKDIYTFNVEIYGLFGRGGSVRHHRAEGHSQSHLNLLLTPSPPGHATIIHAKKAPTNDWGLYMFNVFTSQIFQDNKSFLFLSSNVCIFWEGFYKLAVSLFEMYLSSWTLTDWHNSSTSWKSLIMSVFLHLIWNIFYSISYWQTCYFYVTQMTTDTSAQRLTSF